VGWKMYGGIRKYTCAKFHTYKCICISVYIHIRAQECIHACAFTSSYSQKRNNYFFLTCSGHFFFENNGQLSSMYSICTLDQVSYFSCNSKWLVKPVGSLKLREKVDDMTLTNSYFVWQQMSIYQQPIHHLCTFSL